jgi:hypothetical protein
VQGLEIWWQQNNEQKRNQETRIENFVSSTRNTASEAITSTISRMRETARNMTSRAFNVISNQLN